MYGQPRSYEQSALNFKEFMDANKDTIQCDFYFHTWFSDEMVGQLYAANHKSRYQEHELEMKASTLTDLEKLFNPVAYAYDAPQVFDISYLETSRLNMFGNSTDEYLKNIVSQFESRRRIRDLFKEHCTKPQKSHDFVITCRIDFLVSIKTNILELNPEHVYVCDRHLPRKVIPDNFIISSMENYLKLFDLSKNLPAAVHDPRAVQHAANITFTFHACPEYIVLVLLLYTGLYDKTIWSNTIPG